MSEIIILEKPDEVSFDEIHNVLEQAHSVNEKNGFLMATSKLSGEQICQRVGEDGKCWIAMDGDRIVGTLSVRFVTRNNWYSKGKTPDYMLAGVLPEYQGKHINSMLAERAFEYAKSEGYAVMELDTAENNAHAIKVYEHQGFRLVDYVAKRDVDHYSVVMAKWLDKCPYSERYCRMRYCLRRIAIRFRYKTGKKKRFGL